MAYLDASGTALSLSTDNKWLLAPTLTATVVDTPEQMDWLSSESFPNHYTASYMGSDFVYSAEKNVNGFYYPISGTLDQFEMVLDDGDPLTAINIVFGLHNIGISVQYRYNFSQIFAGDDELNSGSGNDKLDAFAGNDAISGGAGNDTLSGGTGNDSIDGGAGIDWVSYHSATSAVTVSLLNANPQNTLGAGTDSLYQIENLLGGAYADQLTGDSGNNVLDGGVGADKMNGGAGNDTYMVDNAGDVLTESSSTGGTDTVKSSVSFSLAANLENLILTGTANLNGTGNTLANSLAGNVGANVLNGGTGADKMNGGAGNDTYMVDNAGDVLTESSSAGGTDTVKSSVSFSLAANLENLILTGTANLNGTGNTQANSLTGNAGANTLNGGAGIDKLNGGTGNDVLIGGIGNDILLGGTGKDYFVFNSLLTSNIDVINGFSAVDDTIRLENAVFAKLAVTGTLKSGLFKANITGVATDTDDRIVYETDTGKLFYDTDGSGSGAKVQFATLTGHPTISYADFVVI